MRSALIALSAIALACACGSAEAALALGYPRASQLTITPAPRAMAPTFAPGASSLVGTIGAVRDHALILVTIDEGSITVDLTKVRDVWRETSVDASALEVGDDLFINGDRTASGFVALYVDANIGRIDGVIRSINGDMMEVAPLGRATPIVHLAMSRYLRSDSLLLADVRPGDTISAVVYRPRSGVRRITKMWR